MNIKLYFATTPEHWLTNDAVTDVFRQLLSKLQEKYPQHTFTHKCSNQHSYENGVTHNHFPTRKFGFYQCIVENTDNGKYILLNYFDTITTLHENNGWDLHNLVETITTPGTHLNNMTYEDSRMEYTPSSYIYHSSSQTDKLRSAKPQQKTIDHLFFRGKTYLFRKYLETDSRYEILDSANGKDGIGIDSFLDEIASQKISLSLNGTAEITYRDIESFALYSPVLRPTLSCKFHNELIPDYHYIAVNLEDIKYKWGLEYYSAKADRIYNRYLEVKDDDEYLEFVSNNARKWFLENGTIKANVDILFKNLKLNKLL